MKFFTLSLCITMVASTPLRPRPVFKPVLFDVPEESDRCEPVTTWLKPVKENAAPQEEEPQSESQQTIKGDQNMVNALQEELIKELRPLLVPFDQSLRKFQNEVVNLQNINVIQAIQESSYPIIENPVITTLMALEVLLEHLENFANLYQAKHTNSQAIEESIHTLRNFQGGEKAIHKEIEMLATFQAVDQENFNVCRTVLTQLTKFNKILPTPKTIQTDLKTIQEKLTSQLGRGKQNFKHFPIIQFVEQYQNYVDLIQLYHQLIAAYQRSFPNNVQVIETAENSVNTFQSKLNRIAMKLQSSKDWKQIASKLNLQNILPENTRTVGCCGYSKY